jgi:diguanylate cyclase (GGDEF)-like protein/PAS domain S-box-containing protein
MARPRRLPFSSYLVALVLLFVATAAAGVAYGKHQLDTDARARALADAQFSARQASAAVTRALSELAGEVAQVAATPHLDEAFVGGCSLKFGGVGPFDAGNLDVVRPNGTVACSSSPGTAKEGFKGAPWFRADLPGPKLYGPMVNPVTGTLSVAEVSGLPGGGAVAGFVDLVSLGPGLEASFGGPQKLEFLVTNARSTELLASSPNPRRWTGAELAGTPFSKGRGSLRRGVTGTWRIFASSTVAPLGWKLYAGYDEAQFLAATNKTFDEEISIIIAGLLVSTFAAVYFSRSVTRPVERLAKAVRGRARGQLATRAEVRGPAEVASLAEGFNDLVDEVEQEFHQRQRAEEATRMAEESYRHLFSHNPQPMWVYDTETLKFLAVNASAVSHYGYSREEFAAMTIRDIRPPEDVQAMEATVPVAAELERSGPWRHQKKSGEVIEVEVTSHSLDFEGHRARFVMAENVTQRQAYERQLRELALRDELTGLANRAVVLDQLERALEQALHRQHLALVLCGLDHLKDINEAHGHRAGDSVIREAAKRLETVVMAGDTLGRLGAADFALVTEHIADETDAISVAGRLEGVLASPFNVEGKELFVTASMGIVLVDAQRQAEEVLRDASAAMHQAQEVGGARYEIFNSAIRERAVARVELASALRRAVERGELRLYYQPEVDVTTGTCAGVEALMRWWHPARGLVPPAEFIPVAEETGSILALGHWALQEACRQAAEWRGQAVAPPQISVNLSAHQLALPDLVSQVTEALDQAHLDASSICLELTETALMQDADSAMATLGALHDLGVQLSIDDFGTGYSSLLYLRRYPVDYLKIDRTFVAGFGADTHDAAIASAIIGLAHSFGLKVVAEGVETEQQLELLRSMGCDLAQGYLWSQPVPSSELLIMLHAR